MRASLLPALLGSASAAPCVPKAGPWDTYTAAVIYKRNAPASVAAKDAMQGLFCARFGVSPCAPGAGPGLHIARDFDIALPAANFTDVVIWLQQNRHGAVNGAGYDLDVIVYPNTDCPATDISERAVYAGHRSPTNTNAFSAPRRAVAAAAAPPAAPRGEDDTIFVQCSSSSGVTCATPFANNTGCSGDANVDAFHFHFYYVANDPSGVDGANAYIDAAQAKFNLNPDVCADNSGMEQPHDKTCWLSGPGSSGPLARPNNISHQGPGGSFVYPVFSMYVKRVDYLNVLSWTMVMKNAAGNGKGDIDFLIHPVTGCNYADHVYFGLHATSYIPANKQACAGEAGWSQAYAPAIDPDGVNYPGNAPVDGCGLQSGAEVFDSWSLHVFYSDESAKAKDAFVAGLAKLPGVTVGADAPQAYADPTSLALASEQELRFGADALGAVLPAMLVDRPAGVDLRLVPLSTKGQACRHGDAVSRAMYAGERWQVNEHAFELPEAPFVPSTEVPSAPAAARASGCAFPPRAYVLYMMAAESNGYQMCAAGLNTLPGAAGASAAMFPPAPCPTAVGSLTGARGMAQAFARTFSSAKNCSAQYPKPEPSYGDDLCLMGGQKTPYMSDLDPLTVSYSAAYVPPSSLAKVLSWAMDNRIAAKQYYNVDLRLVPLTDCAPTDFTHSSLKAGNDWRLNLSPL